MKPSTLLDELSNAGISATAWQDKAGTWHAAGYWTEGCVDPPVHADGDSMTLALAELKRQMIDEFPESLR